VNIYLPMIPEAAVAMLACARIGAPHSVVFGGFSSQALADRINDAEAKVLVTADGGYRRGSVFPLKAAADEACASAPSIEHVVVVRRGGNDVEMVEGRDQWYHDLMADASADCPAEPMEAEHLLYLLYTSGTTGKPKGIMHTSGGYLTHVAFTHKYVFDLHPDTDVFWCTADVGWVTGHSYIVYGPLANGATQVMYEGVPNHPDQDRFWAIVEKYGVTILYTAPTAIRTFMKWGDAEPAKHDLSSLRLLGSVGEPINPEAWMWYQEHIGGGRCPIVDTWWQTETGGIMISPLPGATTTKPGSATFPLPGVSAEVVDDQERHVAVGGGYLTLTRPWPGMLRGIWGDPERFQDTYWSRFPGRYFAGDGAKLDDDGYLWLLGRVDDVMNVSGHRISTTEVESALVSHPSVAEAAVVGATDDTTGQAIIAYVILRGGKDVTEQDLRDHVATEIGSIAKPKKIYLTPDLPKTRSGKIMRRLLRDVAEGRNVGDTTTLADASIVDELQARAATASED
jgi:acetyl-CoA synthetase